jgi:Tol biopolymer transport system component
MKTDQRITVITAWLVITVFLLATLGQCQTAPSGTRASTPSPLPVANALQSTIAVITATVVEPEPEVGSSETFSPTPRLAATPPATVLPTALLSRQPEIVAEGMLDCVSLGTFSQCVDDMLNIAFEVPSSWGEIEAVLRTGGYAGYAYDYYFDGKTHAETYPLVAGGRSADFSEGRGAMPTDFAGYGHAGLQKESTCDPRWNDSIPICRQVTDDVAWMIRFPNAKLMCEGDVGSWTTRPAFRIEVNLPNNPTINGFVFEASFFSKQFSNQVEKDLYPLLGISSDMVPRKCDAASQQVFDAQLVVLIKSITTRSADAETLKKLDQLTHLAGSIAFQTSAVAPVSSWRHILFVHNHDGATELWTVDQAGGEARRQIRPEQTLQDPAVSPSGETIAYARLTGNYGDVVSELWLMDRDGTNPRSLYVPPADRSVLKRPTWSPQGREVYFLQLGDDRLLRIAAGGGEPTVVLTDCLDFALSPDGQWLIAVDLDRQLAIFGPDGSRFRDVEPQGTVFTDYYSLAVSPDGDLLAFRATEEGGEDTWNLYVMDRSGRNVRRLTDLSGFHPATTSSGQVNGLAWTADGAHLVYSVDGHRNQSGIWLTGLDGGEARRLWRDGEWTAVKGPWYESGGAAGIAEEGPSRDDVQALLDDYSQALSSGEIAHPVFYSPAMQDLIPERRSYYDEFHQVALHSDLLGIGSRYELRSVTPDAVEDGLYHVRAVEVVVTTGRYRPPTAQEYTLTRAALWAMARTDHPAVREALHEYIAQQMRSAAARFGDGESYETCWIVQHHLLVQQGQDALIIVQDSFTDAASDNPGSDVVDWAGGQFVRHKPDLTLWPDYVMYHEPLAKIESLGRSMLDRYSRRYGGTPPPDPHPTWLTYTSADYGFSFRYPPGWRVSEHRYPSDVQFPQDPDSPNFVWLYRGDGPEVVLRIGVRWPDEAAPIQRTGTGAGEIETQGSVPLLGRELSREVLVYDGRVKAVLYHNGQEIDVEGLILTLSLDAVGQDYAAAEIGPDVQAEADEIVASFVLAAEAPPR